jgi:hypothetical protein
MRQKLHLRRPSHATVVAYLALFIALATGGAYASHLVVNSSDVVNESLLSQDVKGKGGTATTAAVNGTLTGADISGQPAKPSVGQPFVQGSLTAADVKDKSLIGADLAPSALPMGRAATRLSACDPETANFEDCGSVTVNLTRTSRVLVVASATWATLGGGSGTCRIGVQGQPFGPNVQPGELTDTTSIDDAEHSVMLTNVTDPQPPGNRTFGLACQEASGNIIFSESMVSVVVLSSA